MASCLVPFQTILQSAPVHGHLFTHTCWYEYPQRETIRWELAKDVLLQLRWLSPTETRRSFTYGSTPSAENCLPRSLVNSTCCQSCGLWPVGWRKSVSQETFICLCCKVEHRVLCGRSTCSTFSVSCLLASFASLLSDYILWERGV